MGHFLPHFFQMGLSGFCTKSSKVRAFHLVVRNFFEDFLASFRQNNTAHHFVPDDQLVEGRFEALLVPIREVQNFAVRRAIGLLEKDRVHDLGCARNPIQRGCWG